MRYWWVLAGNPGTQQHEVLLYGPYFDRQSAKSQSKFFSGRTEVFSSTSPDRNQAIRDSRYFLTVPSDVAYETADHSDYTLGG